MKRFWSKVRITPGCWLWLAYRNGDGYGQFRLDGTVQGAHRVSWVIAYGDIPPGQQVLHKCDVPACVNPGHLFLGTGADNTADMIAKGRDYRGVPAFGVDRPNAKLTEAQVLAIRKDLRPQSKIATDYGVGQSYISRIKRGQRWATVTEKGVNESCGL